MALLGAARRRGPGARPGARATAAARRSSPRCPAPPTAPRCASGCAGWSRGASGPRASSCTEVFTEEDRVQLHLSVHAAGALPEVDVAELQEQVRTLRARGTTCSATCSPSATAPSAGRMLAARWAPRLPDFYRAATAPRAGRRGRRRARARWSRATRTSRRAAPTEGRRRPAARAWRSTAAARRSSSSQATPLLEHLGLRVIEEVADAAARRRRAVGPGLQRARRRRRGRSTSPTAASASPTRWWRSGAARRSPTRCTAWSIIGRPGLAAGRGPARLPPLPPAHRLALHRVLPERRIAANPESPPSSSGSSSCASIPRARGDEAAEQTLRDEIRDGPRRGRAARPRPDPAQPARPHRRDRPDQRLQGRPRRDGLQAAHGRRAGDPAARAAVRDLRLRARHGGHPPARRPDRPRRHPLVGPHGLPHRGLRPACARR